MPFLTIDVMSDGRYQMWNMQNKFVNIEPTEEILIAIALLDAAAVDGQTTLLDGVGFRKPYDAWSAIPAYVRYGFSNLRLPNALLLDEGSMSYASITRVVEQPTGTFYVQFPNGASLYYDTIEHMPEYLRDSMRLLRAMDVNTGIKGVGRRMSDMTYWVSTGDEDDVTFSFMVSSLVDQAKTWVSYFRKTNV